MNYSYSYSTSDPAEVGVIFGLTMVLIVVMLAIFAVSIASMWRIYQKAGKQGWECIVPFYSYYVMYDFCLGNGWLFLLQFVPCANIIAMFVLYYKLCTCFGKGVGFYLGVLFLPIVFLPILAFGNAQYLGNGKVTNTSDNFYQSYQSNNQYFDEDRYK